MLLLSFSLIRVNATAQLLLTNNCVSLSCSGSNQVITRYTAAPGLLVQKLPATEAPQAALPHRAGTLAGGAPRTRTSIPSPGFLYLRERTATIPERGSSGTCPPARPPASPPRPPAPTSLRRDGAALTPAAVAARGRGGNAPRREGRGAGPEPGLAPGRRIPTCRRSAATRNAPSPRPPSSPAAIATGSRAGSLSREAPSSRESRGPRRRRGASSRESADGLPCGRLWLRTWACRSCFPQPVFLRQGSLTQPVLMRPSSCAREDRKAGCSDSMCLWGGWTPGSRVSAEVAVLWAGAGPACLLLEALHCRISAPSRCSGACWIELPGYKWLLFAGGKLSVLAERV